MGSAQQVNKEKAGVVPNVAKQKERSEAEYLRATVKNQRSQIKNLKKELERARKRSYQYEDFEERVADSMIEEDVKEHQIIASSKEERCPECKTKVQPVALGSRQGIFCECGYRRTRKS
jgi:hypothetical protein